MAYLSCGPVAVSLLTGELLPEIHVRMAATTAYDGTTATGDDIRVALKHYGYAMRCVRNWEDEGPGIASWLRMRPRELHKVMLLVLIRSPSREGGHWLVARGDMFADSCETCCKWQAVPPYPRGIEDWRARAAWVVTPKPKPIRPPHKPRTDLWPYRWVGG
jgi:hypothetical protein